MKRIISIFSIWGILTGSIAFALEDASKIGAEEMLAPVMCIDAELFQQGYNQAIDTADQSRRPLGPVQAVEKFIAESESLKNDSRINDFLAIFKKAFNLYEKGYASAASFEGAVAVVNSSIKLSQNKNVMDLKVKTINMFNESARLLETINIDELKRLIPAEEIEIVYLVLTLKAEVSYQLAEKDSDLNDRQKLNNYSKVRTFLLDAFSLQNIEPDFQNILIMGTACAKLATDAKLTLDEKLDFSRESLDYFKLAKEKSAALEQTNASKQMIDEMYYTYFTVLYFAGDVCKEKHDYTQAILFYDKVVPLVDNLRAQPDALPGLKGFYLDYYRLLWVFSDNFYDNIAEDFKKRKEGIFKFYTKTRALAGEFIELLSKSEVSAGVGGDPLVCIAEVSVKLAGESIKEHNWAAASEHLECAVQALKNMHEIRPNDQYLNFSIAKMNMDFILQVHEFIKAYIKTNGSEKAQIKELAEMFDRGFFAEFLANLEKGEYQDLLEKLSKTDDIDAEELLTRNLFCGSSANNKICFYLEKALHINPFDRKQKARFDKSYGYITRIALALAYLYEGSYAKAKQKVYEAANYTEQFGLSGDIVKTILPQAVLDGQKGKKFITDLLCSRAGTKIKNNIMGNKDLLRPKALSMLKDIFTDKDNERLAKNSARLLNALGIEDSQPRPVVVKKANNGVKVKGAIKTAEVLIIKVNEALQAVETKMDKKPKRTKKKGKKKEKKQKPLDMNSLEISQLSKALSEMTEAYQKRGSSIILDYLKNLVKKEQVFKNLFAARTLIQIVADMEKEEAVDILKSYIGIYPENDPVGREVVKGYENTANYFRELKKMEVHAADLTQRISQVDAEGLAFSQAQQQLNELDQESKTLLDQFSHIKDRQLGKELHHKCWESISQLLADAGTDVQAVLEGKKNEFLDACTACEQELDTKWREAAAEGKSAVEKIISLKVWQQTQAFPQADDDIIYLPKIQDALTQLSESWDKKQQDIKEMIEKFSLICKDKVRFEIADDISNLHFENIDILMGIGKSAAEQDMFEVMKAVFTHNPNLDIVESITGQEHPNSTGVFPPVFNGAKEKLIEIQKALRIAHDFDKFASKYEAKTREILKSDIGIVQKIKEIRDLLTGEFENGPTEEFAEETDGIMAKAMEDFFVRSKAIFDKQEEIETVCRGQFRLQIEKEYAYLCFTPLVDKVDITQVQAEIRAIWQEALTHNLNIEMKAGKGVEVEAAWVKAIADIWGQEYEVAFGRQQEEMLIHEKVAVDTQAVTENVEAVAQAI